MKYSHAPLLFSVALLAASATPHHEALASPKCARVRRGTMARYVRTTPLNIKTRALKALREHVGSANSRTSAWREARRHFGIAARKAMTSGAAAAFAPVSGPILGAVTAGLTVYVHPDAKAIDPTGTSWVPSLHYVGTVSSLAVLVTAPVAFAKYSAENARESLAHTADGIGILAKSLRDKTVKK